MNILNIEYKNCQKEFSRTLRGGGGGCVKVMISLSSSHPGVCLLL